MSSKLTKIDEAKCASLNLNTQELIKHQNLIHQASQNNLESNYLKIKDTCRLSNHGILQPINIAHQPTLNITAFVPSAGASSRFLSPLADLVQGLLERDREKVKTTITRLKQTSDFNSWILPEEVDSLKESPDSISHLTDEELDHIGTILSYPKALFPCTLDKKTFVEMKTIEHDQFSQIQQEVYITPKGKTKTFEDKLSKKSKQITFLEQGPDLSTIRFLPDGNPMLTSDDNYSLVPAGHGALVNLFPKVYAEHPDSDCIFIRNADNISGTSPEVVEETNKVFSNYSFYLNRLRQIRDLLVDNSIPKANEIASEILGIHQNQIPFEVDSKAENETEALWKVLFQVFHTPKSQIKNYDKEDLIRLYSRPLNILGVVPNQGTDVGGTPVFVDINHEQIKICLEVPHASPADKEKYLLNPELATHFNPVFAMVELNPDISNYSVKNEDPFWILVKKEWQGKQVQYYESVLYELIGNSIMSNVLFLEIPRFLFNPNKTLNDCVKRLTKSSS